MTEKKSDIRFPLSFKFSLFTLLMGLTISGLILVFAYQIYDAYNTEQFMNRGKQVASVASKEVDWDRVNEYYQSGQTDEAYDETLANLRALSYAEGAEFIYVLLPVEGGFAYIYDTDEEDTHLELGTFSSYEEFYGDESEDYAVGEIIEPLIMEDPDHGLLVTVYFASWTSNGTFAGYLGVDYAGEHLVKEREEFILQVLAAAAGITIAMTVLFYLLLRRIVIRPINKMADAAESYSFKKEKRQRSQSIAKLDIRSQDELGSLCESLKVLDQKVVWNVKELEEANERAARDSMTGLLNREAFRARVMDTMEVIEENELQTFIMVDLDNFKHVNDEEGHVMGDDVILATAGIIRSKFRPEDLVARIGGDEFAVYYQCAKSVEEVQSRLKDLSDAVHANSVTSKVGVTISLGAAFFGKAKGYTYEEMYILADEALYESKEAGRDCFSVKDYSKGKDQDEG